MRILIVEDERKIANSIKKGLEQEKYAVDIAFNAITGYDLASEEEYDVIVLDLMLPDGNGLEICTRLRKNNNSTPILILTAKGQIKDKIEGLNSGADDYLTKPFSFEELLARLRALSRRPKKSLNNSLKVLDLSLNTQTYEVKRQDKKLNLSSKEFSLLEYLMRHPGQILKKQNIINHVWDYDSDILPNTVEVTIRNLRKKIDYPFKKKPLIHTIRGFGYKIE